jgi:creatinine amidohydrolase
MWGRPLLYERLTWPEVRRAAGEHRVCLIPVGTLEDHGPHLPVDTDLRIIGAVCRAAAEAAPDEIVLLPPIPHGYDPHHMDFPGPISIGWDTFCRYCTDVGRSLAHHGFTRMLFYNGHGSNQNLVEMAARLTMIDHPDVLAAAAFYLVSKKGIDAVESIRESPFGGMAHADELETSIYLHLDPDAVAMDRVVDEHGYPDGESAHMEWWADGPLKLMPWWSSFSRTGVQGTPSLATAEKGKAFFDAAVDECVRYVRELLEKPLPVRREPRETLE